MNDFGVRLMNVYRSKIMHHSPRSVYINFRLMNLEGLKQMLIYDMVQVKKFASLYGLFHGYLRDCGEFFWIGYYPKLLKFVW